MSTLWNYAFFDGETGSLGADTLPEALENIEGGSLDTVAWIKRMSIREMFEYEGWPVSPVLTSVQYHLADGRKPMFFEVKNTYAFSGDGKFDPVGFANLTYLAEIWATADGFSFNGCVSFPQDAIAPADAVHIFEQLDDYRVLDMETFERICRLIDVNPDEIEHFE